jgi:hypothetical protein
VSQQRQLEFQYSPRFSYAQYALPIPVRNASRDLTSFPTFTSSSVILSKQPYPFRFRSTAFYID